VSRGASAAVPPPTGDGLPKKKGRGCLLWAVVILAILLIFCLIAAAVGYFVVWPKLKGSNRVKQATAMAEMTKISVALEGYKSSSGAYPSPGHNPDSYYSIVDLGKLAPQLTPTYLKTVPLDPWGHPYEYGTSPDDGSYVLICTGSDGVNALEQIPDKPKDTHCYEDEIVLEKGTFVQKPGGDQESCSKGG
jgi:general secretion pathway protein G